MESNKIDILLEAYFDGSTNLEEQAQLLDYFNNQKVADHLLQYKPIFIGLSAARKERSTRDFKLVEEKKPGLIKTWWYTVAALIVVAFGIGSFLISNLNSKQEEKEALIAFEKSKKAMIFLSENLNKGAKQISYLDQFDIAKDKFWKESSE